jgi:hypothetical protein
LTVVDFIGKDTPMKKVELLKELPSNLALVEAQQDAFDDEENFDLDFEFEILEPRVAFWDTQNGCNLNPVGGGCEP